MVRISIYRSLTVLFWLLLPLIGTGQGKAYSGDPDTSYFTARNLAFDGKRDIARDTLKNILTKYPDYTDVRSLLASTYSWDGKYGEAREQFNRITSSESENKEVWVAAVKNEIYAEDYYIAYGLANKAITHLGKDAEIEALQMRALDYLTDRNEKKKFLDSKAVEVKISPADSLSHSRIASEKTEVLKNTLSIDNSFDLFDKVFEPMVYSSISYIREADAGKIIPRINYANRFETHGLQYELDFYPRFSSSFYGYLNYGYSDAPIFPKHRIGAEVYANLPKAVEASLGIRYLDFGPINASLLTASVGLYRGNYYFSFRPYATIQQERKVGLSGGLLARKYLKDTHNYLGVEMGLGFLPELQQFREGDELLAETLLYIESQRLAVEYQFTGKSGPNRYKVHLGAVRQELVFDSGNFVWSLSTGLRYQVRF